MTQRLKTLTPKQREWLTRIREIRRSGLSVSEYARVHDFSPQQLYTWTTRLRRLGALDGNDAESPSKRKVRRAKTRRQAEGVTTSPRFSPVEIVPEPEVASAVTGMRIRFANGVILETAGTECPDASTLSLLASLP